MYLLFVICYLLLNIQYLIFKDEVSHDRVALQPVTEDPGQNDFGETDV